MSHAISPLDGRYRERVAPLSDWFSEFALMRERCAVELDYVLALEAIGRFRPLTAEERRRIEAARSGFGEEDFHRIKEIEAEIRHDVKACELFLRERLALRQPQRIHFGLTSEDINNLAYTACLHGFLEGVQLPRLGELLTTLRDLAEQWKDVPFPARTHGQAATPTTAGKEIAVFLMRLRRAYRELRGTRFFGKLNGATGTYAAQQAAFPDFDWIEFSRAFVTQRDLEFNLCTTQVEDHDSWAAYLDLTRRINGIVLDLDLDLWEYISRGWLRQKPVPGEVGSSTMPHKVNPIRFENSEGNLTISNALLAAISEKLSRSRMQRDLSDSTVSRNLGVALAHAHLAIGETVAGLRQIDVNPENTLADLDGSPELLAEPYQTILKAAGVRDAYERLRRETRGQDVALADLHRIAEDPALPTDVQERLKTLRTRDYVGLAVRVCEEVVAVCREEMNE